MIVLGIDPGYAIVGYGALNSVCGKFMPLCYGAITTDATENFSKRLDIIYDGMKKILDKTKADALAIEKLYFQNNQKTAIYVAEARGVILLSAQRAGVPIYEYTPLQVKTAVTGYGKAQKPQVMQMTKRLLSLKEMPKLDDTADALAIAICHAQTSGARLCASLINKRRVKS